MCIHFLGNFLAPTQQTISLAPKMQGPMTQEANMVFCNERSRPLSSSSTTQLLPSSYSSSSNISYNIESDITQGYQENYVMSNYVTSSTSNDQPLSFTVPVCVIEEATDC